MGTLPETLVVGDIPKGTHQGRRQAFRGHEDGILGMDLRRRQESQQTLPDTQRGERMHATDILQTAGVHTMQNQGTPCRGARERRGPRKGPKGPPVGPGGDTRRDHLERARRKDGAGPLPGGPTGHERHRGRRNLGNLGGVRTAGRGGPAGAGRGIGVIYCSVLLLALSGQRAGAADGDENQARYPGTNLGNRTDGPGFEVPPRAGSWIRTILPPELDPNEPIENLNRRFEEARRGWRRTDPYYRFMPGDVWSAAPRRRGDRNEPIFPLIRIPESQQGIRIPEGSGTWGSRQIHAYTDALTSDIDDLANRTPGPGGTLRPREWRHQAAQTEGIWVPGVFSKEEATSILHRHHLQGPAPYVYYVPPRIWREGHQAEGFPREVQARAEPWRSRADHTTGSTTALQTMEPGVVDGRNSAREEGITPGPFAAYNRDGSAQTPLQYDPRRRGSDQSYPFGNFRRVSGRLWEHRPTGRLFIVPADPRSTRSGPFYSGFVEAGAAGRLWWEFQHQSALARLRARQNRAPPGTAAREPVGDGYSGDEEEERRTTRTVLEWTGSADGDTTTDPDSDGTGDP